MKFIKEFKGNLNIGVEEIQKERAEIKKETELEKYKKWEEFNKGSKF